MCGDKVVLTCLFGDVVCVFNDCNRERAQAGVPTRVFPSFPGGETHMLYEPSTKDHTVIWCGVPGCLEIYSASTKIDPGGKKKLNGIQEPHSSIHQGKTIKIKIATTTNKQFNLVWFSSTFHNE